MEGKGWMFMSAARKPNNLNNHNFKLKRLKETDFYDSFDRYFVISKI